MLSSQPWRAAPSRGNRNSNMSLSLDPLDVGEKGDFSCATSDKDSMKGLPEDDMAM